MDIEAIYDGHVARLYANLRGRHAARRGGRGRNRGIVRPAIPMPFTRDELATLIRDKWFSTNVNHPIPCTYCAKWIDAGTFSIDHYHSWRETKDSSFPNLRPCCQPCNELKGDFDGEMFVRLLQVMDCALVGIPSKPYQDEPLIYLYSSEIKKVFSLMRMGWGYKRTAFYGRANATKKASLVEQLTLEEPF